ncbi:hypothetical protein LC612_24085 [Nostoc sp. CHAB 5834]|nr:hypothetical protein [Nostoc sp. CHAB 5834]
MVPQPQTQFTDIAVSRARELFVLVGNLRELELAGGETKRLVEHIRLHGEIRYEQ